jgi:uroporphyrinogen-III synthase
MAAERLPLADLRVLVTRPESRDGPFCTALRSRGARVLHLPVYRIGYHRSRALTDAVANLAQYDWVVFTSAHAVTALERLGAPKARVSASRMRPPRVAVVGDATARAARAAGWRVTLRPREATGEALARDLARRTRKGSRILVPGSSRMLPAVKQALSDAGAIVDVVVAYRILPSRATRRRSPRSLASAVDVLTFTSPSTVEGLECMLGTAGFRRLVEGRPSIVIGPTTARALRLRGVSKPRIAVPTTLAGMVRAVAAVAHRKNSGTGESA